MSRFKAFSVIIHIAGWLLFMAFPLVFLNSRAFYHTSITTFLQKPAYWIFCVTYMVLFYSNAYLFIPSFFLKKKYVIYGIISVVLLAGVYTLRPFDKLMRSTDGWRMVNGMHHRSQFDGERYGHGTRNMPDSDTAAAFNRHNFRSDSAFSNNAQFQWRRRHMQPLDSTSLFIFLMIMALSMAIKTVQQWQLTEQRAARAEADKTSAELSFLKAQINPHFLFNTLNNIYTLAAIKDDNAADSIMKLSNIMRYVTDDVAEDFVPLQSEIDCISDYIELQRLRIGKNTKVNFEVEGAIGNKKIAPLVMMTFVENVFKYGISKHEPSGIDIKVDIQELNISFYCKNRIFSVQNSEFQRTGIGIKNTKQRLEHLYPGKHLLSISSHNNEYIVQLTLQV
ncbi:sensor histidine kinase [Mucilaginibacter sp. SMC90]|uniref:sensor histidine kinase n=1 Tax=Mucilaginibacter sp. SMC90 TaxID=2929803 RepID=UPI001FB2063A|nr:sensor histidine kinase [Mucilaginibacter sp. SMC90]UOE49714.1 sensor histidine kinase [Mucilaginibacter sp. SMC90]